MNLFVAIRFIRVFYIIYSHNFHYHFLSNLICYLDFIFIYIFISINEYFHYFFNHINNQINAKYINFERIIYCFQNFKFMNLEFMLIF